MANYVSHIFVYFIVAYKCKHGSLTQFWVESGLVVNLTCHKGFIFFRSLALCSCSSPMPFCGASPVSHDTRIDSRTQGRMLLTYMLVSHSDIV